MSAPKLKRNAPATKALIFLVSAFILFSCFQVIYHYGSKISGDIIKSIVDEKSKGQYKLNFDELTLSYRDQLLTIKNIELLPHEPIEDSTDHYYHVSIPELSLSVNSILDIYLYRELTLEYIAITDPFIRMFRSGRKGESNASVSMETGDLFKLINKHLVSFALDSLSLVKGSINYRAPVKDKNLNLLFNNIDFYMEHMLIDDNQSNAKKFLNTDNIKLILTNQEFHLPDSLHTLSFKRFELSTKQRSIRFKNIHLQERTGLGDFDQLELNRYDIQLDELAFIGVNFQKAYHENFLELDTAKVSKPVIQIEKRSEAKTGDVKPNNMGLLLLNIFGQISVNNVVVNEASGIFDSGLSGKSQKLKSGLAYLTIKDFQLDSNNYANTNFNSFYKEVDIRLIDQKFTLPDSSHNVSIGELQLNSLQQILTLQNTKIAPLKAKTDLANWLEATIPQITTKGFEIDDIWSNQPVTLREIDFHQPTMRLKISSENAKSNKQMTGLMLASLNVFNGDIHVAGDDFTTQFRDLTISLKNIIPGRIKLDTGSLSIILSKFQSGDFEYQSADRSISYATSDITKDFKNIQLSDFYFNDKKKNSIIRVPEIKVRGFDLSRFLQHDKIQLDTIHLANPQVELAQNQSNTEDSTLTYWLKNTQLKHVKIDNGNLKINKNNKTIYTIDGIGVTVREFAYDSMNAHYQLNLLSTIDTMNLSIPSINHSVVVGNLKLDQTETTFEVGRLSITPNQRNNTNSTYHINGKDLSLRGVDFDRMIKHQEIYFEHGDLHTDHISVTQRPENKKTENNRLIEFGDFTITNKKLTFHSEKLGVVASNSTITIDDFNTNLQDLIPAKNLVVQSGPLALISQQLEDSIRISQLHADWSKGAINMDTLEISIPSKMELYLPNLIISGFKPAQLIDHKLLNLDSIQIDHPKIKVSGPGKNAQKNDTLELPVNIEIGHFNIDKGQIAIHLSELINQDSLFLNDIDLSAGQLSIAKKPDWFKVAENLSALKLKGRDFGIMLPDSLYRITVDEYQFDKTQRSFQLDKIRFIPLYNRGEFQTKIQFQQDWFDGVVRDISIENIRMDSLLKNTIHLGKITVNQLDLDTHRDKRLPREEGIYKPLPQSMIRKIPVTVIVDTVLFKDSYVSHSEFSENGELPGSLFFRNINGSLTNLTNHPLQIQRQPVMDFRSTGTLMNTGDFLLHVRFDLLSEDDQYTLNGSIGNMELTELNRFLEHTAFVHIRGGTSSSVSFQFEANENYAVGDMEFYYQDLKISVLDQDTYDTKGLGVSVKSFFANTFVVNSKNPHFLFLRDGHIFHERDKSKSIFNYWGKALLSGVVSSIGAKNNKKAIKEKTEEIRKELELSPTSQ